jgi:hypothetical protein
MVLNIFCTTIGIITPIIMLIYLFSITLPITAIIVAFYYEDEQKKEGCITEYKDLEFGYMIYLKIYGFLSLFLIHIFALFVLYLCFKKAPENETYDKKLSLFTKLFVIICLMLQFIWFIIGAFLFFATVNNSCDKNIPLRKFGLSLFIIQCIFYSLLFIFDYAREK